QVLVNFCMAYAQYVKHGHVSNGMVLVNIFQLIYVADGLLATYLCKVLAGSSAIDAGSATVCQSVAVNNVDQRGISRSQDTACDVGAVEMEASELGGTAVSLASSNLTLVGILGGLLVLGIAGVVIRQRQA
ncbi:MAG: choice-of-anchor Q domain-containing protein, partial [Chloroflexota bacterium]